MFVYIIPNKGGAVNIDPKLGYDCVCLVAIHEREKEHKFFSAPAAVFPPSLEDIVEHFGQPHQNRVTAVVPILVVEPFEMIDVPHGDDVQRLGVLLLKLADAIQHGAPVPQSGKRIGGCLLLQTLIVFHQLFFGGLNV